MIQALLGGCLCAPLLLRAGEADNKTGIGKAVSCENEQNAALPRAPGHMCPVQPLTQICPAAFPKPGTVSPG